MIKDNTFKSNSFWKSTFTDQVFYLKTVTDESAIYQLTPEDTYTIDVGTFRFWVDMHFIQEMVL
jgi:hypothetical protein